MNNKTSDKNVANIEIIENFIFELKSFGLNKDTLEVANELENLLSDYTRQKQINEEHQKINGELREKVKELEKESKILEFQNKQIENYAEELKKYNKTVSDRIVEYKKNSIPKQVVKEVLQNNRNELFSMTYLSKEQYRLYEMQIERINKIEQELLEGEK